jgi:hypothetical protein
LQATRKTKEGPALNNGTWKRVYVLQIGLNHGQPYTVPNYAASLNPATDSIRNIAGRLIRMEP